MNERIKELAITGGIYDCICDPYDKLKNGDPYSSVMVDLERFAELIVRECAGVAEVSMPVNSNPDDRLKVKNSLLTHFGVERYGNS